VSWWKGHSETTPKASAGSAKTPQESMIAA
jgi:hypothetical protein